MLFLHSFSLFAMEPIEEVKKTGRLTRSKSFARLSLGNKVKRADSSGEIKTETSKTSSSSLSPTTAVDSGKNDSPLGSPITTENTPEDEYLKCVPHLLKKSKSPRETAYTIAHSYFIFTCEKELLSQLLKYKKEYPREIVAFLEELIFSGFPNGIKNLQLADVELEELKKGLVSAPILDQCFINDFTPNAHQVKFSKRLSSLMAQNLLIWDNPIKWEEFDLGAFFKALTARDICLAQAIHSMDFKAHLENQKKSVDSIRALGEYSDRTTRWVRLQILSIPDKQTRDRRIKQFVLTCRALIQEKNFHEAMAIGLGLSAEAEHLMAENARNDENWKVISDFLDSEDDFISYREHLSNSREHKNCFPFFYFIIHYLVPKYEQYNLSKDPQGRANALAAIAKILGDFSRYRSLRYPDINLDSKYIKLVCSFKEIRDETLDICSSVLQERELPKSTITSSQKLETWMPRDFAFLLNSNGCADKILGIFNLGVHEGKDLIEYMGKGDQEEKEKKLYQLGINKKMVDTIISAQF